MKALVITFCVIFLGGCGKTIQDEYDWLNDEKTITSNFKKPSVKDLQITLTYQGTGMLLMIRDSLNNITFNYSEGRLPGQRVVRINEVWFYRFFGPRYVVTHNYRDYSCTGSVGEIMINGQYKKKDGSIAKVNLHFKGRYQYMMQFSALSPNMAGKLPDDSLTHPTPFKKADAETAFAEKFYMPIVREILKNPPKSDETKDIVISPDLLKSL
jgi:hypothetical protein